MHRLQPGYASMGKRGEVNYSYELATRESRSFLTCMSYAHVMWVYLAAVRSTILSILDVFSTSVSGGLGMIVFYLF